MPVFSQRNFYQPAIHDLGNNLGHDEGGFTDDERISRIQKCNTHEEDQLRRTIAYAQSFGGGSQMISYSVP